MNNKPFHLRFIKTLIPIFTLLTVIAPVKRSVAQQNSGKLADVSFIEGHWKAVTADRTIEGQWMPADGDNMLGFMRMMTGNKASMYELLAYEQNTQGLVSRVKHFRPGMVGMEEKDKFDQYNFLEATKGRAVFQKEGEDLRIVYEKRSNDQFAIMRGNMADGKWTFKDLFLFNRVK
ncbi:DUF6265 family protein [Segetibacter sp.]|jgi:hypothetical protein|uniref:DUF6265 family protein n=1 Tax=Segetibacter sp. TaxID=2231182 RepID=UPI00262851B7|nr:DUF6265 family protein [Segetibacter sp.]MCW3082334.1 hypothetical protein [Segetibacter sp.]